MLRSRYGLAISTLAFLLLAGTLAAGCGSNERSSSGETQNARQTFESTNESAVVEETDASASASESSQPDADNAPLEQSNPLVESSTTSVEVDATGAESDARMDQQTPSASDADVAGDGAFEDVDPADNVEVDAPSVDAADQAPGDAGSADGKAHGLEDGGDDIPMLNLNDSEWLAYEDPMYGFRVAYPPTFAVNPDAAGIVAMAGPTPKDAVVFMETTNAMADMAPPPFAIYVFDNASGLPLEEWLSANGIVGAQSNVESAPYAIAETSGVEVLSRDFMAPGRSIYMADGTLIYQLTPVGEEGNVMLTTFQLS